MIDGTEKPQILSSIYLRVFYLHRRLLSVSYQFLRPFSNFPKPLFQSEANCEAIGMTMNSHPRSNKTHYRKKGFALSIVSKVRAELGIGLFHGVTVMIFANKEVTNACTFAANILKGRRN